VLAAAFERELTALDIEQTSETLMAVFKVLTTIAFDVAEAGDAPRELIAGRLAKTARKRLPRLKSVASPVWPMKTGTA
jgi:hypothetical protein